MCVVKTAKHRNGGRSRSQATSVSSPQQERIKPVKQSVSWVTVCYLVRWANTCRRIVHLRNPVPTAPVPEAKLRVGAKAKSLLSYRRSLTHPRIGVAHKTNFYVQLFQSVDCGRGSVQAQASDKVRNCGDEIR